MLEAVAAHGARARACAARHRDRVEWARSSSTSRFSNGIANACARTSAVERRERWRHVAGESDPPQIGVDVGRSSPLILQPVQARLVARVDALCEPFGRQFPRDLGRAAGCPEARRVARAARGPVGEREIRALTGVRSNRLPCRARDRAGSRRCRGRAAARARAPPSPSPRARAPAGHSRSAAGRRRASTGCRKPASRRSGSRVPARIAARVEIREPVQVAIVRRADNRAGARCRSTGRRGA